MEAIVLDIHVMICIYYFLLGWCEVLHLVLAA